jgi:hypothetical protein
MLPEDGSGPMKTRYDRLALIVLIGCVFMAGLILSLSF